MVKRHCNIRWKDAGMELFNHSGSDMYHAYLLRLWRVEGSTGVEWRAALESVGSGKRIGFARLENLYEFLDQQCIELQRSSIGDTTQQNSRDKEQNDEKRVQ
jgi:hypothetical protein